MHCERNLKGAGIGWLGSGIAFVAIGASGQTAFLGVGLAFLGLGIGAIVQSRKDSQR
ncbi:hypothetical protein [Thermomonas paludicola]|uniref:hypothetical protein n=1 Tax=Thermomonas paludicola TaxID=2884874 RepID=UPI002113DD9E|nr:hypothetical protein [Thermomonas paludicola]